ncbi:MAG: DNA repair protein RecO [Actinobacteria bacterium 13_1_40CM_2_66_13]|nr:MAG: DNA repair protein RecO [Actinobacteria bacterium 13_1_40CM_2_66_13]
MARRMRTWRKELGTYRDRAVVLRKLDYGEADRIFTLLTRDHGKVGAIAKGVRRQESKLGPSLELYGHIDVLLAKGRGELDVVAQVQRVPGYRIAGDMERMAHAALIAELAERVCEDRHPIDGVYELAVLALAELAHETDPRRASAWFLMTALDLLGYAPQLMSCVSCETPLPAKPVAFSAEAGGFLDEKCALPSMDLVPLAVIKVLRLMAAGDIETYRRVKLDGPLMASIEGVLQSQLEYHMDRRLKSIAFLNSMRV